MTCQEYDARIDDYVDDVLPEGGRLECDTHLSTCAACRALTSDLQTIRTATRALEPQVPSPQVWYRLAAAIESEPRGLSAMFIGGWRAAAAVVMGVVLVGSLTWIGARLAPITSDRDRFASAAPAPATGPAALNADEFTAVEAQYTSAITGLENITRDERSTLDAETAEVLNANLTVIDGAIGESRAALDREPESRVAQNSLFEALENKVALLQDTVALINTMRRDDAGGTPSIGTGLNQ